MSTSSENKLKNKTMFITTHGNASSCLNSFTVPDGVSITIIGQFGECIRYNQDVIKQFMDLFRVPAGLTASNFSQEPKYKYGAGLTKYGKDWFNKFVTRNSSISNGSNYTVFYEKNKCPNIKLYFDYDDDDKSCKNLGCNISIMENPMNKNSCWNKLKKSSNLELDNIFNYSSHDCLNGSACQETNHKHFIKYHHPMTTPFLYTILQQVKIHEDSDGPILKKIERNQMKDEEKIISLEDIVKKYGKQCSNIFVFACLKLDGLNNEEQDKIKSHIFNLKRKKRENSDDEKLSKKTKASKKRRKAKRKRKTKKRRKKKLINK